MSNVVVFVRRGRPGIHPCGERMPFVRRALRLVTMIAAIAGAGCAERRSQPAAALLDDFGQAIDVGRTPERIVSLNNTTTEVLFAIGEGSRLVGRSKWDSWPDSARFIPEVGDAIRPNVEAVLARRPDLVLLYASDDNRLAARQLAAAGVPSIAIRIDSIAEFRRATLLLGRLLGAESRAQSVVDSVDATFIRVRAAVAGRPRPTVFFHTWERPLITIGGGSFLTEIVDIAGGRNVYADLPEPAPVVTLEDVVQRNPEVVLVAPLTAARLRASPAWQVLRAVREDRVFAFDTIAVGRPSVTMGMAAANLASLLHPGVLPP